MNHPLGRRLAAGRVRRKPDHATRVLTLFFLGIILLGTILLVLPVASRSGVSCGPMTALFTATSATCVTGLSLVDTYSQWSIFGQVVLLALIQIGGLGYMTFVSLFYFLLHRRIGLRERLVLQQAMALNELDGVIRLLKLVLLGTGIIEGAGAVILTLRFSRLVPLGRALWLGIFHAISAYCNAGFDLMGLWAPGSSLSLFVTDPVVNLTVIGLVVLGGLGFFVWNDLLIHRFRFRRLSVHTRLVLVITGVLLFGGAALILAVEWNNPGTLGSLDPGEKVLAALFQSMTTRTAGFLTVDQGALTGSGKLISILLMFVGGSSGSTAGGIKTVTVGVLVLTAIRALRGRSQVVAFGRTIAQDQINAAVSIFLLVVSLSLGGGVILSATNGLPLGDALYETVSAICTVGLSTGITAGLNLGSQLLLILFMFFGRVGILTISFAFLAKTPPANVIRRPETRVLIG